MPYIQNALSFTIETVVGLYLTVAIVRFLLPLFRVDFHNPVSQMIVAATNPPLRILRRFLPQGRSGLSGSDLSPIALIVIVGMIKSGLLLTLSGYPFNIVGLLVITIADILNAIAWLFIIIILGSAILSWVAPMSQHPAARLLNNMSGPILYPFRKIIPSMQGIDLSPLLALLALNLMQGLLIQPIMDIGRGFFF